jgi:DNA-binding transcriptional ArsR family regulator
VLDQTKVAAVGAALPDSAEVIELARVFGLLGDPNRLQLLTALLAGDELCVCDLAAVTAMSESAVSHALGLLRARRVVSARREGRMAFYRLADSHVRTLLEMGLAHTGHTTTAGLAGSREEVEA